MKVKVIDETKYQNGFKAIIDHFEKSDLGSFVLEAHVTGDTEGQALQNLKEMIGLVDLTKITIERETMA